MFVDEDVEGGHDHEDATGRGPICCMGRILGFWTPSEGWVKFAGSASRSRHFLPFCSQPWLLKDMEAESVLSPEMKINQTGLAAGGVLRRIGKCDMVEEIPSGQVEARYQRALNTQDRGGFPGLAMGREGVMQFSLRLELSNCARMANYLISKIFPCVPSRAHVYVPEQSHQFRTEGETTRF